MLYFNWLWQSFEEDTAVPVLAAVTEDSYLLKPKKLALEYMESTDYRLATKPINMGMPALPFLLANHTDASTENRKTILILAKKFLEHGAQIDEYHHGGTPLHLSVIDGDHELVIYLLNQAADPNLRIVAKRGGRFDAMDAFEIAEYLRDEGSRKHARVLRILRSSQTD